MIHTPGAEVRILIIRSDANFDRACDAAMQEALSDFGVDEDGHFNNVQEAERSTHSIEIEFKEYKMSGSMSGWSHQYEFVAWVTFHE